MAYAVVEVVSGPDGRPAAAKHAVDPGLAARLTAEADHLARAAHPGVVEVVALEHDGARVRLLTRWVPGGTLADARPVPRGRGLRIMAAVAATVSELHQRGLAHGRLSADHVLLDAADHPVLCGFAESAPATPEACAADVDALGSLIELIVERPTLDSLRGGAHRALDWDVVALAARTHDPDLATRPAAATLAAVLTGALGREAAPPAASQPGTAAPRPRRWPGPPDWSAMARRPAAVATGAGAAVLVAMVALTTLLGTGAAPDGTPAAPTPTLAVARAGLDEAPAPLPSTGSRSSVTALEAPPATLALPALVDGGRVALPDGRRFAVGAPGDLVMVGDWDCDGDPTAAVLRPDTGEVFVFDRWPDGEATAIRPVATVPGAQVLLPRAGDRPGCVHLAVGDPDTGTSQDVA